MQVSKQNPFTSQSSTLLWGLLCHWLIMSNHKTLPWLMRIQRCGYVYVWETCLHIGYLRKIRLSCALMCNMYTYIQPICNLQMIILVLSLYTCITCTFPLTSRLYVHCSFVTQRSPPYTAVVLPILQQTIFLPQLRCWGAQGCEQITNGAEGSSRKYTNTGPTGLGQFFFGKFPRGKSKMFVEFEVFWKRNRIRDALWMCIQ